MLSYDEATAAQTTRYTRMVPCPRTEYISPEAVQDTTFADRQPLGTHAPTPSGFPLRDNEATTGLPLRMLLAEDNSVNQHLALRLLERLGYHADLAADGLEVLEALSRRTYDVVLMDVRMPALDGLETTRRLRAELPPERQPHIIAMTASALAGDREICLTAGMDDYITKPVQRETLAAALQRVRPRAVADTLPFEPGAAPIDPVILQQLHANLGDSFGEELAAILEAYRLQLQVELPLLHQAITQSDHTQLALLAHRLCGASATLGARHVALLCRKLEQRGASVDTQLALLRHILVEAQRASAALDAMTRPGATISGSM